MTSVFLLENTEVMENVSSSLYKIFRGSSNFKIFYTCGLHNTFYNYPIIQQQPLFEYYCWSQGSTVAACNTNQAPWCQALAEAGPHLLTWGLVDPDGHALQAVLTNHLANHCCQRVTTAVPQSNDLTHMLLEEGQELWHSCKHKSPNFLYPLKIVVSSWAVLHLNHIALCIGEFHKTSLSLDITRPVARWALKTWTQSIERL